jgi:diguanylate cyclase (GGDEF)-like protein
MAQAVIAVLLALLAGFAIGWYTRTRGHSQDGEAADAVGPHLLPDPALEWLRASLGAMAVWAVEAERGDLPREVTRRLSSPPPSSDDLFTAEVRLDRARTEERPLVERLEAGVLVVRSASGFATAALMPPGTPPHAVTQLEDELDRLLEGLKRRPRVTALAPADGRDASIESIESVGRQLALLLERLTGADVIVGARIRDELIIVGLAGEADDRLLGTAAPHDSAFATMLRAGGSFEETDEPPLGVAEGDRRRPLGPAILIPMEVSGERIGVVAIWPSGRQNFPSQVQHRVRDLIRRAAPHAWRAREYRLREEEATRDRLTGLANRRALEGAMHRVGLQRGAYVLGDVDRFKVLNDTLGHAAGDAALLHVAGLLRRQLRGRDLAARIGGEEFVLWLPDVSYEEALAVAERVRDALETSEWGWKGTPWLLTASFGVAHWPETSRHVDNLFAQADASLYDAKRRGRNRVTGSRAESIHR